MFILFAKKCNLFRNIKSYNILFFLFDYLPYKYKEYNAKVRIDTMIRDRTK